MKWTQYTLHTTTAATDIISSMLDELGVEGIEVEDKIPLTEAEKAQMFVDILPESQPDDGKAIIRFYRDPEEDSAVLLAQIQDGLKEWSEFVDLGEGTIEVSETEDIDWMNNWKKFFKSFRLSDKIVIKPTWETITEDSHPDDIVIEIDPGIAFGTGSHETTKLCMLALEKYVKPGMKLLDVGCGSGILSIAGIKLGATEALGIDIDENALHSTYENIAINGITEKEFTAKSGNIIDDTQLQNEVGMNCYDIVAANILADVIIPLSKEISQHMKPNGIFISSGIINTMEEPVREALLGNGFQILETNHMKDWVSFIATK